MHAVSRRRPEKFRLVAIWTQTFAILVHRSNQTVSYQQVNWELVIKLVGNITGRNENEKAVSSIKPCWGPYLFQTYLRWGAGRLNRNGGFIREGEHISFTEHGRWYKFSIKTRMQSRNSQGHEVGGHSAKDQKQIRTSSWWTNHPGSVHTMFYSRDWIIQSII